MITIFTLSVLPWSRLEMRDFGLLNHRKSKARKTKQIYYP